ncbi:MAG: DUF3782 domain-containing protein [Proteobacteria bacterium]|jgi:hypothetical protein|nr:DUF3782 domain-containing protein [Pseudomonadota bacterium]
MEADVSMNDLRRVIREIAEQSKENERRLAESGAETDRRMRETDRKLAEVSHQLGGLGNRLGEFVEGVVRPGLVRLFRERGIDVRRTLRDVAGDKNGLALQIDLLVVNDTDAVAVEVKSKLTDRDVDDHLERIGKFKILFPEFASKRLLGAIAAMVVPDGAVRYAERCGLFVIGQRGDDAAFLNSDGFEPRAW